jgi:putative SbcD/Mre11-related phosphoesterase
MKFLYNASAVLHGDALIIGDTHFGMEERLREEGIYDENLSERIFEKLEKLLKKTKAGKLIIAGDVKDNILETSLKTAEILKKISKMVELTVVKGNHDGGIEKLSIMGINVVGPGGMVYKNIGIVHGHSWPDEKVMQCTYLISAHQHPQISMRDKSGKIHKEPVWLVVEPDAGKISRHYENFNEKIKLVLMPAFNPLVGSTINRPKEKQLGPVLNNNLFKLNDALVFRLDGSLMGKLKNVE